LKNHLHSYPLFITMANTSSRWGKSIVLVAILFISSHLVAFSEGTGEFTGTAIQAKIDALTGQGGVVQLVQGTYVLDRPILLRSGVRLRGIGKDSILLAKSGSFLPLLAPADLKKGVSNIEISSLVLDGNSSLQTFTKNDCGKRIAATSLTQVDNVGLYLKKSQSIAVTNVIFKNFLNEACMTLDASNLCFVACVFSNCCQATAPTNNFAQAALYLRNTTDSLCLSNKLYSCHEGGICIGFRSHRNTVIGNLSEDSPSGEGICIGCGNDNLILANTVRRSSHGGKGSGAGIAVWACVGPKEANPAARNVIASNTVEHTGGTGIALFRADETRVLGNRVEYANENRNKNLGGISVHQADSVVIEGNQIMNTALGAAIILRKSHKGSVRKNTLSKNPSTIEKIGCNATEIRDNP
jgi:nitrous oxidase accessory protein NosD